MLDALLLLLFHQYLSVELVPFGAQVFNTCEEVFDTRKIFLSVLLALYEYIVLSLLLLTFDELVVVSL